MGDSRQLGVSTFCAVQFWERRMGAELWELMQEDGAVSQRQDALSGGLEAVGSCQRSLPAQSADTSFCSG